ncbi:MAG: ABC transporter ATP-binding protein [Pyrinomonadaceae bacterium]
MLAAQNITVGYGSRNVIEGVSLEGEKGQVIAIAGPNGAGKSTLLKALNGTVAPTSGSIRLDGKDLGLYSRPEIARRISVVAQENETKFPVSVGDFVLAGRFSHGTAFGWESEKDVSTTRAAMDVCGLQDLGGRLMNELSGGERQRALLARAFATEASILLLDEPTNNLDPASQGLILHLVRERCAGCGSLAFVVTHDLNMAAAFADRILFLKSGRLFAEGEPADVLKREIISELYGLEVLIDVAPETERLRVTPVYKY